MTSSPNPSSKYRWLYTERQCMPTPPLVNLIVPEVTCTQSQRVAVRYAIFYHYMNVLDAPIKEHWGGNLWNISLIYKALKMPWCSKRKIRWTLEEVMICVREGDIFQGMIKLINKVGQKINHLTWVIRRNSHRELDGNTLWIPYDNAARKRAP